MCSILIFTIAEIGAGRSQSIPVMVYPSTSQCCDITERFRRRSVRALHTASPRSDHHVASLASEQQCDQHPDQHPDQQEVRRIRNQIQRPCPIISQATRNMIGVQHHAVGEGDTSRDEFEGRRSRQAKVGPCQPAPLTTLHIRVPITSAFSVSSPNV